MSVNKHVQQQEIVKDSVGMREPMTSAIRKSGRKAPGTRYGVLIDWREGSTKPGKTSGRHGHALRDGQ